MPSLLPEFLRNPPYMRLFYHVKRNDIQKVKKYMADGVDANFTIQPEGISPLILATNSGYTEIVRILVTPKAEGGGGVNVNMGSVYGTDTEEEGVTPLMVASVKGNLEIAELLVENGADVNATTKRIKNTALILASTRHHSQIVKLLLEKGADPNIKNNMFDGTSALQAGTYSMDVVHLLVEKGADVNSLDENKEKEKYIGKTPLMIACQGNKRDIVKYLCEHGADPNITNTSGKKASDYTTDPLIKNDLMEGCSPVATATSEATSEATGEATSKNAGKNAGEATGEATGGRRRRHKTRNRRSRRHKTRNRRSRRRI